MAARYIKTLRWLRWSGRIETIVIAAEKAALELEAWTQHRPIYSIQVSLRNLAIHLDSLDELRAFPTYDLSQVASIRVTITTDGGATLPQVSMRLQRPSPAVTIEIDSRDRVRVEGLADRLQEILERGCSGPSGVRGEAVPPIAVAIGGVLAISDALPRGGILGPELIVPLGAIAVAALVGTVLLPGLELLKPTQASRIERFRAVAWGVGVAVIASIAASAILAFPSLLGR